MNDDELEKRRDEGDVATYQGFWSRLECPNCEVLFDVEGDVSNGEEVDCDACNWSGPVEGR